MKLYSRVNPWVCWVCSLMGQAKIHSPYSGPQTLKRTKTGEAREFGYHILTQYMEAEEQLLPPCSYYIPNKKYGGSLGMRLRMGHCYVIMHSSATKQNHWLDHVVLSIVLFSMLCVPNLTKLCYYLEYKTLLSVLLVVTKTRNGTERWRNVPSRSAY